MKLYKLFKPPPYQIRDENGNLPPSYIDLYPPGEVEVIEEMEIQEPSKRPLKILSCIMFLSVSVLCLLLIF